MSEIIKTMGPIGMMNDELEVVEHMDWETERAFVAQFWHDSVQFAKMFYGHQIRVLDPETGNESDGPALQDEMLITYPEQWMLKLFNEVGWFGTEDDRPAILV